MSPTQLLPPHSSQSLFVQHTTIQREINKVVLFRFTTIVSVWDVDNSSVPK